MKRDLSKRIMGLSWSGRLALLWRIFRDPGVPAAVKALVPVIVAYIAVPFDLVPDDIPVLGQLDDVVVVAAGLALLLLLTPRGIIETHLRALE